MSDRYDRYREPSREDFPKYSRLFVIGGKSVSESEMRELFSKFGELEYVSVKRDRDTGQPKGVSYVKFSKTSEAADALENMNGQIIGNDPRPIKVVIASSSKDSSGRGHPDDDIKATRLFIMVPDNMSKEQIKDEFSTYGQVEHVSIVYDKNTGNSKGLAYVNFYKFSEAARAVESCHERFRAKFAESKKEMAAKKQDGGGGGSSWDKGMGGPMMSMMQGGGGYGSGSGCCRLKVLFNPAVSKDMFWALFNIVPGLISCDLTDMTPDGAISTVVYNNPQSAAHAAERIHGFEYPTGFRLQVHLDNMTGGVQFSSPSPSMATGMPNHVQSLIQNIQQATEALKSSGYASLIPGGLGNISSLSKAGDKADAQSVCSAKLPTRQELSPMNTKCEERLFFVLRDARDCPDPAIITDLFCRFGNLIDAACLRGKKCGYARYGSRHSASQARMTLDNEDFLGSRLVIEVADEDRRSKRPRTD